MRSVSAIVLSVASLMTIGGWIEMLWSQELPPTVTREQLVGGSLVRATMEHIDDSEQVLQVTFVLQEVLAGSDCDVGEQFVAAVSREGAVALQGLAAFHPPLEKCQVVMWHVERVDGKLVQSHSEDLGLSRCPRGWSPGSLFGRELEEDPNHHLVLAFCKAIREVAKEDSNRRWERLEALCKHDEPVVAGWAMSVLASVDKDSALPYFQRLVTGEKLPEKNIEMLKGLLERLADE